MKNIVFLAFAIFIIACSPKNSNTQTNAPQLKDVRPNIFSTSGKDITIMNSTDSFSYADYDITVNGLYRANILRKPTIENRNSIDVPIELFGLPDGVNIETVTFTMPGYKEYTKELFIKVESFLIKDDEYEIIYSARIKPIRELAKGPFVDENEKAYTGPDFQIGWNIDSEMLLVVFIHDTKESEKLREKLLMPKNDALKLKSVFSEYIKGVEYAKANRDWVLETMMPTSQIIMEWLNINQTPYKEKVWYKFSMSENHRGNATAYDRENNGFKISRTALDRNAEGGRNISFSISGLLEFTFKEQHAIEILKAFENIGI